MMIKLGAAHIRIDPLELLKPTPITRPKHRARLHSLTPEEKLARRKIKNRAAAQRARDRRKDLTFGLEYCVKDLVNETKRLKEENKKLKEDAAARRAQCTLTYTTHLSYPPRTVVTPLGSAASICELQQRAQGVATVSSRRKCLD
ncbi:hypothetical protein PRIPAC_97646 [Pristionchus pacificus]|uniref:BZIP domain-containing protein n=1 Tax=Pristionchus pacificus TaxID=54126 RepID=A0A2A6D2Q3_PRIPA|nr:hypothetical protein PRIPAC_97646 [Pristionchus pacificus]|eukprot:PDM84678.1 hypothetical protein PRIPAC_33701 [Pristionchus pacificus]